MSALRLSASEPHERRGGVVGVVGRVLGDVPKRPKNLSESFSYIYLSHFRADTFIGGGLPAVIMGQTHQTPKTEARTPTTLVVEETTVIPAFEVIAKAMSKNSSQEAIDAFGEDSCTPFNLEGTIEVGGVMQTISQSGVIEVGSSYTRAQTTAFKLTDSFHMALAVMGVHAPKMAEAIMASMEASRDGGDSAQALADAGFNMTDESRAKATDFMKSLATESTRTVRASVKVNLDA